MFYDNAPAYSAQVVWQFLVKPSTLEVEQSLCSLNIIPCDFSLPHNLKKELQKKDLMKWK
jgi:hypothetical protein